MKKRNSSSGGAALHLGSEYQIRIAAWLAVEMLAELPGEPFSPGGTVVLLRGETQESVDDLLVGTATGQYGFIQAKRRISFSDKLDSDFASVIDQAVRQVTAATPANGPRPWSRELSQASDRLLLVTSSLSGDNINVVLRQVLVRARTLVPGQPLNDAAVTEAEGKVLQTCISLVRNKWQLATSHPPTEDQVRSLLALLSVEVLDVEQGGQGEREAIRTLSSLIEDKEQQGAAWSSVLNSCRKMVTGRSGLDRDALRRQLQGDGIVLKSAELSRKDIERNQSQTGQIDRLIDEARDAVKQHDFSRTKLLLERIDRDHGSHLNTIQRFRVVSNHGFAALGQGNPALAAKRFLEALSIQPEDEKARTNEVLAYYVIGDYPTAFAKAEQIRPLYPASVHLASHWILSSPPEIMAQELEGKLNSILLGDSQIQFSLACKALNQQDLDAAEVHAGKAISFDSAKGQPRLIAAQVHWAKMVRLESGLGSPSDSRPDILMKAEQNAREAIRLAEIDKDARLQLEARALLVDILLVQDKKKEALDEADRAVQLDPKSILAHMARSQAQFEHDLLGEGIASLERAYAIEPRADVAFHYGKALFNRQKGNDLQLAVTVLGGIDLSHVYPVARHSMALLAVNAMMKAKQWDRAEAYLGARKTLLNADSLTVLLGLLAHYRDLPQEAEGHALTAQSLMTPSTPIDVKIHLARLFMLIGRPAEALPLFQEAFDAKITTFDPGKLMDCAARLRRDDVVIATFRTLRKRGVNDWNTVSFGVQYVQRYHPSEAIEVLNAFLSENPGHKLATLFRSVLGLLADHPELICGGIDDVPAVEDLPVEHAMQVLHVLRSSGNADAAVDYAYRLLRLHFNKSEAHRALFLSMSPFEPMPNIQATLDRVEIGAAVRYEEQPKGDPDWFVIEDTDQPSSDLKELRADSQLAGELLGKQVGDTFLLARGMIDRIGVIRQIVPKYVRAYNDCGDRWQIRFPGEPMIQSVHLGTPEEEVSETIDRLFQALQKGAENEVEMRKMYNTISTPLHVFGDWHGTNAYEAMVALASSEDQPVRNAVGTLEERKEALAALKAATGVVLDLSAIATIRLLEIDHILATTHFKFALTENTRRELRETLGDKSRSDSPSIAVEFRDGKRIMHEETVEFKRKRADANRAFLDLIEKHCEIVPVEAVASLPPEKREPFDKLFGLYGTESMLLASKPGYVLWSDDLVQSVIAATEFGARRVWTQTVLVYLAELDATWAKDRDISTAKLVKMDYRITFFDCSSILEAVHMTGARPWESPLAELVRQFESAEAELSSIFPILEELAVRLYRENLLPENRCRVMKAFLEAMWMNPAARRGIINLRSKSAWIFSLNPVGQSQFNNCFDAWLKLIQNPILMS